jgi:trehalose 6-phosphate phosphatase
VLPIAERAWLAGGVPVVPDPPEPSTPVARERWDAVQAALSGTLVCLDFDGTLSPIVDDPERAVIHPQAVDALRALAPQVLAVAVVTGRPCRQVLELGDFEQLADAVADAGGRIEVRGQYGNERWSSADRSIDSPEPPEALVALRRQLPGLLEQGGLAAAYVEEKGLAVAVHTRRLPEPDEAVRRARALLTPVARQLGLALEPGRRVVEVRAPDMDKSLAVESLLEELAPEAVVFMGDDLGDLPAFGAVERFREHGGAGLLVCSGSTEQTALVERADIVVDGPDGVVATLRALVPGRQEA